MDGKTKPHRLRDRRTPKALPRADERILRQLLRYPRRKDRLGKLNSPGWLAGYVYRIAKITGWGYREILEDLPFAAGLQIIHADDAAHGRRRTWTRNSRKVDFDSLAAIDAAFAKIT